ncbi:COP1-interactive protein 1 [Morus notabilis]|uniref:COP1-interactive protein 1 n=1 Tax=Morus notabilis TaxID=981085 RepID=UPI000CED57A3|nr:COP1-interactive protein 1 [Morus notabilis]
MSRITKWKLEKTKVKVVFRLQFHATHIPQPGWDKLFISFIPADSGKATAKTTKANVRSGACKWADPIYETTRLLQDIKTKQYDEKFYKLVVAMGSSRSSVLGEAIINLAHYADALKPSVVALPLQGCDSGATLHVTVQLLTSKTGFREFELQRELRERGLQSTSDEPTSRKISASEDLNDPIEKVNTRVRFKEELPPLEEGGANEEYADSAVGFDGSSSTSESLYAEKHDTSSVHEVESLKSTASGDLVGPSLTQSPQPEKRDPSDRRFLPQGSNDCAHHGWGSEYSTDTDIANVYEENSRLRRNLETAESSIHELKLEVNSLQSHADEIGIEAQKFAHLLASELASGEQLAREVYVLGSECSNFKADLEQLKDSKINSHFTTRETIKAGQEAFFQELQLRWHKGLMNVEDKIKEIQSKGSFGFHERDIRAFNSDLEALRGVLHDLKQETGRAISGLNLVSVQETREMTLHKADQLLPGTRLTADFYQPDDMLHCLDIPCLVSQEIDSTDAHSAMKGKIFELIKEVDDLKAEREGLTKKMDQMECYYEALVQELEENQRQMMGELQNLRNEHSTCLYTISATKAEMENMHQDMNKQIMLFSEEKSNLDSLNKDLERRALTSEAALKRARLNYSIAVNQLQKDLELLSVQVLSMYETNENLIKQAFSDSSQPISYEEVTKNKKLESKEFQAVKLSVRHNGFEGVKKQNLDGDIISEDLKRSLHLQKGVYQKVEEVLEVHTVNVHLDIFSKTLQATLLEASAEFRLLKEKVNELTQQLQLLTESKELLMLRLQSSMDEVHHLTEDKDTCHVKCNDMALQIQVLENNFQNVTGENFLLSQKISEYEMLIKELRSYENQFQACSMEKIELENSLKKEMLANGNLQNKISSLLEEMEAMRSESEELASVKENLQSTVNFLQEKLQNLLAFYDEKGNGLSMWSESVSRDLESNDLAGIMVRLEQLQRTACEKIFRLLEEKQDLVHERDVAHMSLNKSESDKLAMKHKFEDDVRNIRDKLDVSSILVQKLQAEVDAIANRLKISSEAEETYAQQHSELLSAFHRLEVELQQLTSKNKDLAQEVMALGCVSEEFGRFKQDIAALSVEKEALVTTLKDKNEESAKLEAELSSLRSSLQSLHDELDLERSNKSKLESKVTDLTSQLNERHSELLNFDQQDAELVHLRQLVTDLELEKSSVICTLSDSERSLKAAREECSSISSLEAQISEMHEFSIASDVRLTFTKSQYESYIEELQKKYLNLESKLNGCLATEAHYIEENSKLMTSLDLLRSELDASIAQNRLLLDTNSGIRTELDEFRKTAESMEATSHVNTRKHALEVERLKGMVVKYEEEIDNLMLVKEELEVKLVVLKFTSDASTAENRKLLDSNYDIMTEINEFKKRAESMEATSHLKITEYALEVKRLEDMLVKNDEEIDKLMLVKEELEVKLLVLKFKLDEQQPQIALLEEYKHELLALQNKYDEITHRLSEQVLKTEEFKNLSIHLKELRDKADAECLQAREKREPEGVPPAMQESLRIVFIKEQYESKLQELKHQLLISKKHAEEMLLKLQDAIDEVENRKKSEASHSKRNEELGTRILELELDLHSALSEKRELMRAYDVMKAEKECSLISLECCKEELEASLQKCNEEKSKFAVELTAMKDLLERYASALNNRRDIDGLHQADCISDDSVHRMRPENIPVSGNPTSERFSAYMLHESGAKDELEPVFPTPTDEADQSNALIEVQQKQDVLTSGSIKICNVQLIQEGAQHKDTKHVAFVNDHFKGQTLKSSIDQLNKELEKMKHESLLLSQDDHQLEPISPGLRRELMQLNKVNEELGSKFPLFNEFPCNGNALERVLALEMELAEALQEKKSSIHFQSSFLKQHSDEEAVFKSFKDINELIKDMLEIKGRYAAVETELKEMHERYSQLSLQFAEVEGERQKLMMTLKNVRASKKVPLLSRSSTAPLGGSPLS